MLVPSKPYLPDPGPTFWASLRYFSLTRLVIASVLLGAVVLSRGQVSLGTNDPALFLRSAISYVVLAAVALYIVELRRTRFYAQLGAQLLLDLVAVTIMMHASDGTRGGMAVLYLLPVAGAAILSPPLLAMGMAAFSALLMLGETLWRGGLDGDFASIGLVQAGLYGAACFAIAIVLNRLAARLIAQEKISALRALDLGRQIEINRLVVADMQDGVLVLAADGSPRAMNPAAARMLRVPEPDRLLRDGWGELELGRMIHDRFLAWLEQGASEDDGFEIETAAEDRSEREVTQVRLRARFVGSPSEELAADHVVFLEDMQRVDERAQQLKLASMGRLTASIAHEIRNPLAAISHASALLAEGQLIEPDRRLLHIVHDNTRRLDRIVENILQLSRRGPVQAEDVPLVPFVESLVAEFCRDHSFDPRAIDVSIYREPSLHFNPEHLRQVLINLLQNARRHASGNPGSINLIVVPVVPGTPRSAREGEAALRREIQRIELIVQDDGRGIDSETRNHLFEPFFTTHHRGTGLGLYLARELCLANGATLGYVPNADASKKGGFVVNAAGQMSENDLMEVA
jgi:two-component system sensor histidine kinase PilS (NtrC family)